MEQTEKRTKYTLLTNRTDGWEDCYDDYLEWCEINNIEPAEKDSPEYWQWVYEEVDETIDCDLMNMEYSKIKDRTFLISGQVGLWYGTPTIKPIVVKGLVNAVKKVWGEGDRHFTIELDTETGYITSRISSHDDPCGNTRLEVRMLNRNGEKWAEAANDRGDDINFNNHWWSKITNIGEIY